ncbi:MAG: DNA translocase FtsK [Pirellulaceae bacterium]|nr:MAG: DNA translocase FtsK [Pirellulaceae bacterium]
MTTSQRSIELDIEAILLAAACVLGWISLLTYDPADPVGPLPSVLTWLLPAGGEVYPPNPTIANACGWIGALIAHVLVQGLGAGSIVFLLWMSLLAMWMLRAESNFVGPVRQFGWVLVIVAITTFFALLPVHLPFSPVIGPGGYLGATTATWLNAHFALTGSLILTTAVLLAGLLLSTDYVVFRAVAKLLFGGASVAKLMTAITKKRMVIPAPALAPMVGLEAERAPSGEAHEQDPPIRIRRGSRPDTHPAPGDAVTAGRWRRWFSWWKRAAKESAAPEPQRGDGSGTPAGRVGSVSDIATSSLSSATAPSDVEPEPPEEPKSDFIELKTDQGDLQLRADLPHEEPPPPTEIKIKAPKRKKATTSASDQENDSLAHMDDTLLPAGAEEYILPSLDLLLESDDLDFEQQAIEVRRKARILEKTFKDFGFNVRVVEIETGPVIAQYEVELEAGLRLSKITGLADDLAIALRVPSVRIVAPIPGKNTVGIEVPNEARQVVRLREVIEEAGPAVRNYKIPLFLGKDVSGNPLCVDLATLPHLLIAGRTGTGKSVCLNAIIASMLMTKRPDEVRMLMIDPKMVELSGYGRLPHLMHPVVTDMRKAEAILAWAVDKMEERYALLARAGVRHITSYNELGREELLDRLQPETPEEADCIPDHLPFIVIVADEMADLMMTAGKEVEQHIIRLAQKSRAVGIHLILATQKPTVDVITGLIKSNLPARISFQVASRTDSRVVLDEMGAEKLLGNGDMLFLWPGTSMLLRGQGTYLSDDEINAVVDHCSTGEQHFVNELVNLKVKDENGEPVAPGALRKRDELYAAAVDIVVREGRGSCSLLQRALGIGYGRAARLIDYMAEDGIVGQYNGSQAREVLLSVAEWEAMQGGEGNEDSAPTASPNTASPLTPPSPPPPPRPPRSNKIRPHDDAPQPAAEAIATKGRASGALSTEEEEEETLPWEEDRRTEGKATAAHYRDAADDADNDAPFGDDVEYEDVDE